MLGHDLRFVVLGTAFLLGGCSAQADTSYRGTPLAQLHGTVQTDATSSLATAPPPLEAALLWSGFPPGQRDAKLAGKPRQEVGTSVPVSGQFPAQFALQIFTPPPDAALFGCFANDPNRPGRMAHASLFAILAGSTTSSLTSTDLYGMARDYTVTYVDADLPAVSDCPGGALTKGYHLYKFTPTPDIPGCVRSGLDDPKCNGPWPYTEVPMTTELTLLLSHEDGLATPPPGPSGTPTTTTTPQPDGP